jgi:hypothetical protein
MEAHPNRLNPGGVCGSAITLFRLTVTSGRL